MNPGDALYHGKHAANKGGRLNCYRT